MPHPGNDRSFSTLFDGNPLCSGNGAAADRGGVIGNGTGKAVGQVGMGRMEGEELQNNIEKVFDVFGLGLVTALGVGLFAFMIPTIASTISMLAFWVKGLGNKNVLPLYRSGLLGLDVLWVDFQ